MKNARILLFVGLAVTVLSIPPAHGQYLVRYGHFNNGGGASFGGHQAQQTAGQALTGTSSGAQNIVRSGFWYCWYLTGATYVPQILPPGPTDLYQNYPNPFNPATTIAFNLERATRTSLVIYDLKGARVRTLLDETLPEGRHAVLWSGSDDAGRTVGSGVYICRLVTDHSVHANRLLLLK